MEEEYVFSLNLPFLSFPFYGKGGGGGKNVKNTLEREGEGGEARTFFCARKRHKKRFKFSLSPPPPPALDTPSLIFGKNVFFKIRPRNGH